MCFPFSSISSRFLPLFRFSLTQNPRVGLEPANASLPTKTHKYFQTPFLSLAALQMFPLPLNTPGGPSENTGLSSQHLITAPSAPSPPTPALAVPVVSAIDSASGSSTKRQP